MRSRQARQQGCGVDGGHRTCHYLYRHDTYRLAHTYRSPLPLPLRPLRSIRDLESHLVVPAHGNSSLREYYDQVSCHKKLKV